VNLGESTITVINSQKSGSKHTKYRPVLVVKKYATLKSIPFLESVLRVLTSGFLAIDHCCGTITKQGISESKKSQPLPYLQYICHVMCVW
jgi:hypothetical protein